MIFKHCEMKLVCFHWAVTSQALLQKKMKNTTIFLVLTIFVPIFANCNATLKSAFGGLLDENNVKLAELLLTSEVNCPTNRMRIEDSCYFIPEGSMKYDEERQKIP